MLSTEWWADRELGESGREALMNGSQRNNPKKGEERQEGKKLQNAGKPSERVLSINDDTFE